MAENQNPVFTDDTTILGDGTVENPLSSPASVERFDTNSGWYTNGIQSPPVMAEGVPTVLTGIQTQAIPADGTYILLVMVNVNLQPGAAATEVDFSLNFDTVPQGVNFARYVPAAAGALTSIPVAFQALIELSGDGNQHEVDLVANSIGDDSNSDYLQITVKVLKV